MKKRLFSIPLMVLSCFALSGCGSENRAVDIGKGINDYDLSGNKEIVSNFDKCAMYGYYNFSIGFNKQVGFVIQKKDLKITVNSSNNSDREIDLIEAYLCNENGEKASDNLTTPKRFVCEKNKGYTCCSYLEGITKQYVDDSKSSVLRLVFNEVTVTFNLWTKAEQN